MPFANNCAAISCAVYYKPCGATSFELSSLLWLR
jgi:hypothetical protein